MKVTVSSQNTLCFYTLLKEKESSPARSSLIQAQPAVLLSVLLGNGCKANLALAVAVASHKSREAYVKIRARTSNEQSF